jgi:uncharacterized radical SAM protein YgiQ
MFLPTTRSECRDLGWHKLDIILVTGDSYIDSPYIGTALIGKYLVSRGFKVGIIAQPDPDGPADITRLGEPALWWGVSGGSVDSLVANYTATKKWRKSDDFTPGGVNNRRPDRAVIVYSNLIRRHFKESRPIVIGGIEASLRRISHYDYWSNSVRRSVLFDARADILIYGMGEQAALSVSRRLKAGLSINDIPGTCYISKTAPRDFIVLPSHAEVKADKQLFARMFVDFYNNNDPLTARGLYQKQDTRYLVQNPPAAVLEQAELDALYELEFEHVQHPYYSKMGRVKALDTIKFSITTHRGCYGECNFCAIAVHQGRTVRWRSEESILKEARALAARPGFKGIIHDLGGPTANMYGYECVKKLKKGNCLDKRCLFPEICRHMPVNHRPQTALLKKIAGLPGIKKAFVASGIRYDLILSDAAEGEAYLKELVFRHVSGQMKVAPEHMDGNILKLMGKPSNKQLVDFKNKFDRLSSAAKKKQFLTYYFIAAHPGCTMENMRRLSGFARSRLKLSPEQVQIFTPTPSTFSTLMYYTGIDPFSGKQVFVEKSIQGKSAQKATLIKKSKQRAKACRKKIKDPGSSLE